MDLPNLILNTKYALHYLLSSFGMTDVKFDEDDYTSSTSDNEFKNIITINSKFGNVIIKLYKRIDTEEIYFNDVQLKFESFTIPQNIVGRLYMENIINKTRQYNIKFTYGNQE